MPIRIAVYQSQSSIGGNPVGFPDKSSVGLLNLDLSIG
jgi:hypothetical protein